MNSLSMLHVPVVVNYTIMNYSAATNLKVIPPKTMVTEFSTCSGVRSFTSTVAPGCKIVHAHTIDADA